MEDIVRDDNKFIILLDNVIGAPEREREGSNPRVNQSIVVIFSSLRRQQ